MNWEQISKDLCEELGESGRMINDERMNLIMCFFEQKIDDQEMKRGELLLSMAAYLSLHEERCGFHISARPLQATNNTEIH